MANRTLPSSTHFPFPSVSCVGKYDLDFKNPGGKQVLSGPELAQLYTDLSNKYPIVSIEDPFDQVREAFLFQRPG